MQAQPSGHVTPSVKQALSFKIKALIAATVVFVLGGFIAIVMVRNEALAADHAARVASGLRQNEQMANGKDCPWDGRSPH